MSTYKTNISFDINQDDENKPLLNFEYNNDDWLIISSNDDSFFKNYPSFSASLDYNDMVALCNFLKNAIAISDSKSDN